MTQAAETVAAGDYAQPVAAQARSDELGRLAAAFEIMVAHVRDARQRLEERVRARTRELEAFAYSISHDLRSPLRAMEGFSQALIEDYGGRLDETGRHHAERVVLAARKMDQLIDDLLAYSQVTRADLPRAPMDLQRLMRAALEQLDGEVRTRQARIVVEGGLPAVVAHGSAEEAGADDDFDHVCILHAGGYGMNREQKATQLMAVRGGRTSRRGRVRFLLHYAVVHPLLLSIRKLLTNHRGAPIDILVYSAVANHSTNQRSVLLEDFVEQVEFFHRYFAIVPLDKAIARLRSETNERIAFAITLYGPGDHFWAVEYMRYLGIPASLFIPTGHVRKGEEARHILPAGEDGRLRRARHHALLGE